VIEASLFLATTLVVGVLLATRFKERARGAALPQAWRDVASELGLKVRGRVSNLEVTGVYAGLRVAVRQYSEQHGTEREVFFFVVRAHLPPPRKPARRRPRPVEEANSPYRAPALVTSDEPRRAPRVARDIQLFDGWAEREYEGILWAHQLTGVLDEITTAAHAFMDGEYELVD
jgi:hypothetical protein